MIIKFTAFQRFFKGTSLLAGIFSAASALATPQVATPNFSPAAGLYASAQSVTITSATSGASIAYTTDGSTPTESGGLATNGTLYSGPISIVGTTFKAIAFESGLDSSVASAIYTINIPAPTPAASGGGGAPSYWFLGFLVFAGILRWKLRKISTLT
jgi:hypothetical protein